MSPFHNLRFLASAYDLQELPPDNGAEVAFAGRSNAGKSSAINALARRNRLAFVSKTPGRTQTINFFDCGANRRLVDLPGYGYAAVPQRERAHWGELISAYLQQRASLRGLVMIVDARHALARLDHQLLGWYAPSGQPVLVLLTKADKMGRQEAAGQLQRTNALLTSRYPAASAQLFSAVSGLGVRSAQLTLQGWLKADATRERSSK
jgi:GTP-binding protein